jgi:hypothetical protein
MTVFLLTQCLVFFVRHEQSGHQVVKKGIDLL